MKWHEASCSGAALGAARMAAGPDSGSPAPGGEREPSPPPACSTSVRPATWRVALCTRRSVARCIRRSVACVSFRKMRSNSSL